MNLSLFEACQLCTSCELSKSRTNVVFSRGNPQANLMVIGEAPGAIEDERGEPFVGRSGALLERLMKSVGIDIDEEAYICNLIKCRPPRNRRPTKSELSACRPWLNKQIEVNQPKIIVLAGATAVDQVLGIKGGLTKIRGNWMSWQGRWVMPVFHPAYLLRNPSLSDGSPTSLTCKDLLAVRDRLNKYDF